VSKKWGPLHKKQAWEAMNSYTHSRIRQFTRRFNAARVEPNFTDEEIKEVIDATTTTVLLLSKLFCVVVGRQEEAKQVEGLLLEFAPEIAGEREKG
jgi:hypothetical protein